MTQFRHDKESRGLARRHQSGRSQGGEVAADGADARTSERFKVTAARFRFAPPSGLRQLRVKWVRRVFPQSEGEARER